MIKLVLLVVVTNFLLAKNVLILNSYSPTFQWTKAQSTAIINQLQKEEDIKIYVEFMDTKEFKPTPKMKQNMLRFLEEKYQNTHFDAIATTDDNAINFVIENQSRPLFKDAKYFFSGVNNTNLKDTFDKEKFTGVFEVKKPRINLHIAKEINKNLKTFYLVGDGSTTAEKNIVQYKERLSSDTSVKYVYINDSEINVVLEQLKGYDKDSVMMLLVFSAFTHNGEHISDFKALELLSQHYANPMLTHDSVYVHINDRNIIGGNCSDATVAGGLVAKDILDYFKGTSVVNIPFKFEQGNSTYLNEQVLSRYKINIEDLAIENKVVINKVYSVFQRNKTLIYTTIALFVLMLAYIYFKLQKEKALEKLNRQIQELNDHLEERVKEEVAKSIEKEELFKTIFYASKDPIAILDLESNFLDFNDTYSEMTGYTKEELLQKSCISMSIPQDVPRAKLVVADVIKFGFVKNFEKSCYKKDGSILTINMTLTLMPDKQSIIISTKDITEMKEKDRIISEQTKLASMGEMIGNIAHQWRQPLSTISTLSTGMILKNQMGILQNEDINKTSEMINHSAQYLSKTIDDFRNFIKGDSQKVDFNLSEEIDSFLLLVEGVIRGNSIDIIENKEENLIVHGYPNELKQCLINLFNNAKDALVEKEVEHKLIFITTYKKEDRVVIVMKDNAGGIPEEIITKIFEPYFTTKHKSQGTGIGLSMTYNLILSGMNGTIVVHNRDYTYEEKKYSGAEFMIELPIHN